MKRSGMFPFVRWSPRGEWDWKLGNSASSCNEGAFALGVTERALPGNFYDSIINQNNVIEKLYIKINIRCTILYNGPSYKILEE